MEVLVQSRSGPATADCQVRRQLSVSSGCRSTNAPTGRVGLPTIRMQAWAPQPPLSDAFGTRQRQPLLLHKTQCRRQIQHTPSLRALSQDSSNSRPAPQAALSSAAESSSSRSCASDKPQAQPPISSSFLALRKQAVNLATSADAAAKVLLWFITGKYIPSRLRVLVFLLRAERFYRKHIRTMDTQQLVHELNFLPEFPSLETLCPALAYLFVLFRAVFSTVQGLASVELLQGSAAVPGLPELPTVGTNAIYEFPDKSDQPETPGYKPLGEWVGPRGMKPWERNAVTISEEERKKLWKKQMRIATLQPYNSAPRERKALVALAFLSTALTQMWILLHVLLVPLVVLAVMLTIEKPLFWVLAQLYKIRRYVGWQEGTIMPTAPPP